MGCGKTTFGRALSEATGLRFFDLDKMIEKRHGASVAHLFALHGEEEFRIMERDMLHEAAQLAGAIIACGGGTPCFFDNADFMNTHGITLWLKASEECLLSRLVRKREKRPLIAGKTDEQIREVISSQLASRTPHYSKARFSWLGDSLEDRRQIDANIADFLNSHPLGQSLSSTGDGEHTD